MNYSARIGVALTQLLNAVCGGWPDESLSARAWRGRHRCRRWAWWVAVIDWLFFWQDNHCEAAYLKEMALRQQHPEYR